MLVEGAAGSFLPLEVFGIVVAFTDTGVDDTSGFEEDEEAAVLVTIVDAGGARLTVAEGFDTWVSSVGAL